MRITVRLFAGLRERAGADHVELDLPDDARARDVLAAMGLQPGQCIVALDREYARAGRARARRSGGRADPAGERRRRARCGSSRSPISRSIWRAVAAAVRDPRAGAVVCFEGVTRDVEALDYEAYVEMARAKLRGDRRARRPSGTGCARSRSCTAPAACR